MFTDPEDLVGLTNATTQIKEEPVDFEFRMENDILRSEDEANG